MNDKSQITNTPRPLDSVCQRRMDFLDQLANSVEKLGRAKLSLRESLNGTGSLISAEFSAGDVEQLRTECARIRAELENHRASHGC